MRAILLAGGYGTRLRPLTYQIPKCLVPIRGMPLLEIWLERLTAAGFGPYLMNTHYLPEQVEQFVKASAYREHVFLSYEPELLGTAGTVFKNLDFFQEQDGLLIHADNYCLADLKAFVEAHQKRPTKCLLTMMTFRTNTPESCGIVEVDEQGVVQKFYEKIKSPPGNLANGAIYILSLELLKRIRTDFSTVKDFSIEILPKLMGSVYSYETPDMLIDIGTKEAYEDIVNRC